MRKIGMILIVDSWAWLKLLEDKEEPTRKKCVEYLYDNKNKLYTSILNIYEAFYNVMDRVGEEQALEFIQTIKNLSEVVFIDEWLAITAAKVHRSEGLSAVDSFVYTTALRYGGHVLTADSHFKEKDRVVYLG